MPTRAVDEDDGVGVWRNRLGDLGQMQGHRFAIDRRQDQGRAHVTGRTDGPEEVGGGVSLIAIQARAGTAPGPPAGERPFWSHAHLVLEPAFEGFAPGVFREEGRDLGGQVFLNAANTSGSFFGGMGRALR